MSSLPNPGQFQPGQSGNPGGRPKGSGILTRTLARKMDEIHPAEAKAAVAEGREPRTNAEVIADKMLARALAGDGRMITAIYDRMEGKAKAVVEVDGKMEHTGEIKHTATFDMIAARLQLLREKALLQLEAGPVIDAEVADVPARE